jgi:hypothetical protein
MVAPTNKHMGITTQEQFFNAVENKQIKIENFRFQVVKGKLADRIVSRKLNAQMLTFSEFIKNLVLTIFSSDYRAAKKFAKENLNKFGISHLEAHDPRTKLVNKLYDAKKDPIEYEKEVDIDDLREEVGKLTDEEVVEKLAANHVDDSSDETEETTPLAAPVDVPQKESSSEEDSIDLVSQSDKTADSFKRVNKHAQAVQATIETILNNDEELAKKDKAYLKIIGSLTTIDIEIAGIEKGIKNLNAMKDNGTNVDDVIAINEAMKTALIAKKVELKAQLAIEAQLAIKATSKAIG